MFTGIIAGTGSLVSLERHADDVTVTVDVGDVVPNPVIGESVALDGVCLTVVKAEGTKLRFDISHETLARTTMATARPGASLFNIERALRVGDRLGGHLVAGHVDCVGALIGAKGVGEGYEIEVELPAEGMRYIIEKGSIALAGISLTVAKKRERSVTAAVIPHTWGATTLGKLPVGSGLNVEYDMIGKYVENFVSPGRNVEGGLTIDFLKSHGF